MKPTAINFSYIIYRFVVSIKLILLLSMFVFIGNVMAQVTTKKDNIEIWQGQAEFPAAHSLQGQLSIEINGNRVKAKLKNLSSQANIKAGTFTLIFKDQDNLLGKFKAFLNEDRELDGHWLQYGLSRRTNTSYATPVRFVRDGNKYVGKVAPLDDNLDVYFKTIKKVEGRYSLAVFVPQHNGGRYYHNSELVIKNDAALIVRRDNRRANNGQEQILARGYRNSKTASISFYFPYWGGLYHFRKIDADTHFLLGNKQESIAYNLPLNIEGDWAVDHAQSQGINEKTLVDFSNERMKNPPPSAHDPQLEALLVARNGKLVFEQYFRDFALDDLHDLRSASKSLTGLLPGLLEFAQQNAAYPNVLPNTYSNILKRPLYESLSYPANMPGKEKILLEHVLNMNTGLDCDDDNNESPGNENTMQNQLIQKDWQRYTLDLNLIYSPAERAAYCSGGINLGGAFIEAASGLWVPKVLDDLFAKPLGIERYHLNMQADGKKAYNGGGLQLRARDFLKMGQLLLNNGKWNNKQILSQAYIDELFSVGSQINGGHYSLGWWIRDYEVDGKSFKTYYASGNGGQQLFIVPELDLAVAFLSSSFNTRGGRAAREEWFANIILKQAVL